MARMECDAQQYRPKGPAGPTVADYFQDTNPKRSGVLDVARKCVGLLRPRQPKGLPSVRVQRAMSPGLPAPKQPVVGNTTSGGGW
jgi:hypothetical protein